MLYHFPVTTHLWWIANILLIKNNICTIYHPLKRKKKKKIWPRRQTHVETLALVRCELQALASNAGWEPAVLQKLKQAQQFLIHQESQHLQMSHYFSLSHPCEISVSKL